MLRFLLSPRAAEIGSALLVVIASWIVGRHAAVGLTPMQWACAAFAIAGSISVAVMVRVWPAPQKATIDDGRHS
jgi:hypothetical protein